MKADCRTYTMSCGGKIYGPGICDVPDEKTKEVLEGKAAQLDAKYAPAPPVEVPHPVARVTRLVGERGPELTESSESTSPEDAESDTSTPDEDEATTPDADTQEDSDESKVEEPEEPEAAAPAPAPAPQPAPAPPMPAPAAPAAPKSQKARS